MLVKHNMREARGDTIIEVLIALTVLTVVLVGAYATASRSQNTNRASQERGEAIKVAESQIERLKNLHTSTSPPSIADGAIFCIKSIDNTLQTIAPANDPFSQSLESATLPYTGGCTNPSPAERYNAAVKKTGITYSILVRWERVGGSRDQINMYYRVY